MDVDGGDSARAVAASLNQEQLLHELERKFLSAKSELAVAEAEKQTLAADKRLAQEELARVQALATQRDAELAAAKEQLLRVSSARDQLSLQVASAQALAERRLADVETLQATAKQQAKQLVDAQRREVEALQRAAEQETQVDPLRHSITRLNAEVASAKQHAEWLESQVAEKTKFAQELRKSLGKQTHEYEELKVRYTEERTSAKRQLESARQVSKKLEASLIQVKEQVKEVQAAKAHAEERFQHELSAQRRLAELYKQAAGDANARVTELQELCDSLRQSLAETEEALALETERTKQQVEHLFREQAEASEKSIATLQEQLADARSQIDELEKKKLFALQTAASVADLSSAAGEAHLAAHGLTPKQMYDHIVELEETLRSEREDRERLQAYMDRILREVQEKAPIIMGLRLDHERAVASHAQMTERLEACMQELAKSKSKEEHAWKEKRAFEAKCASLAQTVDDLSRQVQHLLFRSQKSHGAEREMAVGDVVSENLVVFKDVEELQVRNQQLLTVIRELSEIAKQKDGGSGGDASSSSSLSRRATHFIASAESDDEGERVSSADINERLSQARKEVQELRAEREQERQMIGAIVKQRDMYRVLLAQSDNKFLEPSSSSNAGAARAADASASVRASAANRRGSLDISETKALRDLQAEFDDYKKEKQANAKLLEEMADQLRAEMSQVKLAQMQAEVEAKCTRERYDASEARRRNVEDEFARVRAKNEQLSALLVQHQQVVVDTEAKLEDAATRAQSLSIEKEAAAREIEYLKKHEAKLQEELTSLRVDNTNLLKLMESTRRTESIREERDRRECETLGQKVDVLESRLQEAYTKSEAREAIAGASLLAAEQEKKAALTELEKVRKLQVDANEKLVRLEEQKASADSKVALLEKEATHLREQLRKGASAAAAERVAALEVQLRDAQREVQSSLALRKSLTENVSRYKAIAEANEKSLAELSSASEKWKESQELKLQAVEKERDHFQEELAKARGQVKEHFGELNKLRNEIERIEETHRLSLHAAMEKQSLALIQVEGAQKEIEALREEIGLLKADLSSTQENYERELQLHAAEVAKASAARKLIEDEQKKKQELSSEVLELKTRLASVDKEMREQLEHVRKELADAAEAKESLSQQNKLLHSQLERASAQVRRAHEQELMKSVLEKRQVSGDDGAESSSGAGGAADDAAVRALHEREVDDLRSVIAFLRREGEISTSKLELAQQEVQRYRAQVLALESTAERLRGEIKAAASSASSANSASSSENRSSDTGVTDAAKRFAQLEQLSLLRESNATLRDESQKNLAKLKDAEAKVAALEAQLAPLRTSEAGLKAEVASLKQEVTTLNEANKRWKQRVDQLVEKYQQVDPAEHDKIVAENAALSKEVAELKSSQTSLQAELETLRSSEGKSLEEEKTKVENWRKQYDRIKGFAKTWKTKAENLTKQLNEKTKELDDKRAALADVETKIKALESDKAALEAKLSAVESKQQDAGDAAALAASASAQSEKERQDLKDRLEAEQKKSTQLKDFNNRLMSGLKALKKENADLRDQAAVSAATATSSLAEQPQPQKEDDAAASGTSAVPAPVPAAPVAAAPTVVAAAATPEASAPVALKPVIAANVQPPLPPLPPATTTAVAPKPAPVSATASAPASTSTPAPTTAESASSGTSAVAPVVRIGTGAATGASTSSSSSFGGNNPPTLKVGTAVPGAGGTAASTTTTGATPGFGASSALGGSAPVVAKPTETKASIVPAPAPATTVASVAPPTAAPIAATTGPAAGAGSAAPAVSAEEKLRLFALQSMMKKQGLPKPATTAATMSGTVAAGGIGGAGAAAPTGFGSTPTKQPPSASPTRGVTPAKTAPAAASSEEEALKARLASSGPFLKLSPPTGAFGAFGSGGASGLVFGKPGITLPVPASPTPVTAGLPTASAASSGAVATSTNAPAAATGTAAPANTTTTVPPAVVPVETEAHRRSQRLARFAAQNAAAAAAAAAGGNDGAAVPASANLVKRPASGSIDIGAPQKIAKTASSPEVVGADASAADEEAKTQDSESEQASATPSTQPE